MTAPSERLVGLIPIDPTVGCTAHLPGEALCNSQATVQLSPHVGRRCADHPTLPPGRFDRGLAAEMVAIGRADASFAYLRAWLARECEARFGRAAEALD